MNLPVVETRAVVDSGWIAPDPCIKTDGQTHLVVIQPSSFCNINCRYCYVPDRTNRNVIAPAILEDILTKVFASDRVANGFRLVWHNGEPLSLGIDFYQQAIDVIKRVNVRGKAFHQCIQTNGTLINQQWADFFKANDICPTVSIDGPQHIHDANRITRSGAGSFDATLRGIHILRDNGIPLVGLSVVTATSLDSGADIVRFFLSEGFSSLGLIIEEPWGGNPATSFSELAVRASVSQLEERFRRFVSDFFDAWFPHQSELVVREFSDLFMILKKLKGDRDAYPQQEDASPCAVLSFNRHGGITTVSPQMIAGTVENPDRFLSANVRDLDSLAEVEASLVHQHLTQQIGTGIRKCQTECGYFHLCGGGSPASKFYEQGTFACTQTRDCRFSKQLLSEVVLDKLTHLTKVCTGVHLR
jgi:uncharacterized protein